MSTLTSLHIAMCCIQNDVKTSIIIVLSLSLRQVLSFQLTPSMIGAMSTQHTLKTMLGLNSFMNWMLSQKRLTPYTHMMPMSSNTAISMTPRPPNVSIRFRTYGPACHKEVSQAAKSRGGI